MAQLNHEKFVILTKSQGMGRFAREIFDRYQITHDIIMETKNIETAYRLAATEIGITFIPQIVQCRKGFHQNCEKFFRPLA